MEYGLDAKIWRKKQRQSVPTIVLRPIGSFKECWIRCESQLTRLCYDQLPLLSRIREIRTLVWPITMKRSGPLV